MREKQLKGNNGGSFSDEQRPRLLLVDEDAQDLQDYSAILRYLGYEVEPVDSYRQAAARLERDRFDLVIVEQGSVDFEGRSVLSRAVEVDRQVPVLVLTRNVDPDCCLEALDSGASEYVQKPLTTSEIRELVADYVNPSAGSPVAESWRMAS
ncbi:MAG TPA: response regulator [Terriglobia bacterium]|nr:response regulator [Terriglobia bacterium]